MVSTSHPCHLLLVGGVLALSGCSGLQPTGTGVVGMALGGGHSCATLVNNGMRCWGHNLSGQLGNGSNASSSTPVEPTGWGSGPTGVGGGATILDFAAGDSHTCVIGSGGKLFCWGSNYFGQLGLDSTVDYNLAQPVRTVIAGGSPRQANSVVAGDEHTCALYAPGSAACWGHYYDKKPQFITGLSNPQRIAARGNQTCVLEASGTVKCWRMLAPSQPNPTVVPGLSAKRIAAGRLHACAINQSDIVQCWGFNTQGQLGIGHSLPAGSGVMTVARSGPFDAAIEIAAGHDHACALLASGAVECWGSNVVGQTGHPTSTHTVTPHRVITSGARGVAAGTHHTCALFDAGSVRRMHCWGENASGQLGQRPAGQPLHVPQAVIGLP